MVCGNLATKLLTFLEKKYLGTMSPKVTPKEGLENQLQKCHVAFERPFTCRSVARA